jgi:hypothetical protein
MITYITFDELLNEILDEMEMYDSNGLIEPSHLIPVVLKINKELGLRVTQTKECIVEIENEVVKLPFDLQKINFVNYMSEREIYILNQAQGTHKEFVEIDLLAETDMKKKVSVSEDGTVFETIFTHGVPTTIKYKVGFRLNVKPYKQFSKSPSQTDCYVKGNYLKTYLTQGYILLNYECSLEDEDGNLLVVNHPLLMDYYKYAIKRRILENLYFNGEESTVQKLQLIEPRYIKAKQEANGVVDMPEFSEIKDIHDLNRRAHFIRYQSKFI